MRKHTVLTALALVFSLIVGIQFVTNQARANGIEVDMHIQPDALLLKDDGYGKWITAIIRLPKGYDVNDINMSSVTFSVWVEGIKKNVSWSTYKIQGNILTVRFDRALVISEIIYWFEPISVHMSPRVKQEVALEVAGEFYGGEAFGGSDTIKVFYTHL